MSIDLKEIIKNLGFIFKNASNQENILIKFIDEICKTLDVDIIVVDTEGLSLYEINNQLSSLTIKNELTNENILEKQILKQLEHIDDIKINVTLDNLYTTKFDRDILKNIYGIFLPIYMYKERLATVIIYKKNSKFNEEIDILCEYISSILSILIWNYKSLEITEKQIKKENIKSCISTLSYSELEAILNVFDELENGEGLVIASKIADKAGITRSVIVNALRKFESARIIETRSLGMKGTYIKIVNEYLLKEINKFKK